MSPLRVVFLLLGAVSCVRCCVVIHTGKLPESLLKDLIAQQDSMDNVNMVAEEPPKMHAEGTTKKSEEDHRSSKRKKSLPMIGKMAVEDLLDDTRPLDDDDRVDKETALFIADRFKKMYNALLERAKKSEDAPKKTKSRPKYYDSSDEEKLKSAFFPDSKYFKFGGKND